MRDWRSGLLAALAVVVCIGMIAHGPIAQDQAYHGFVDARDWLGVPNAWNVLSNLPFLFLGLLGLWAMRRDRALGGTMRVAYWVFFGASALVALGSAYYHWAPSDATLVWDRLPMTLAFMGFFVALIGERIAPAFARRALCPLLLIGLATVLWWKFRGDLRPYLLVQFLPVLMIPLILLLFPVKSAGTKFLWFTLGVYVLAKGLELYDAPIYDAVGISRHALKHVAAAIGVYFVFRAMCANARGAASRYAMQ